MNENKKELQKETLLYLVFGVLTTVVSYGIFVLWMKLFGEDTQLWATTISFIISAIFAYVTNKLFVFKTKSWAPKILKKEIPAFFSARIFSFVLDWTGMFVFTELLHMGEVYWFGHNSTYFIKLALNVLVVVLNYVLSKFWVFKKKEAH